MLNKLTNLLAAAGLPVVGVSIGNPADRSTWKAHLYNGTPEHYAQAQAIIDGFDTAKEEHNASIDAQIAALEASRPGYVRGVREFMMGIVALVCVVLNRVIGQIETSLRKSDPGVTLDRIPDIAATPGMQNVKALDDQIKALRAQRQP